MKKLFIAILALIFTATFSSCEKEYSEFYSDNKPEIPVTFEGAITHGFNPYITQKVTQDDVTLTLTIPSNSGRKIKEISRVLAGSTAINAGGVRQSTFISSPIAGDGTKVVFKTTLTKFKAFSAANAKLVNDFVNSGATVTRLQIAYMFLVTLDNGQEIIPVPVQVWLTK